MSCLAVALLVIPLVHADDGAARSDDQALIAGAPQVSVPAARQAESAREAPAGAASDNDLAQVEAQARIDLIVSQARLDLVLARKHLKRGAYAEAVNRAQAALRGFQALPGEYDVSVLELQAEGIIARAERLGGPVLLDEIEAVDVTTEREMEQSSPEIPVARRARAAEQLARGYTGADVAEVDTTASAEMLVDRAVRHQRPNSHGYRPGREIVDERAVEDRSEQRLYYQDVLRTTYKDNEARLLTEVDEARVTPTDVVSYPDNWPEIVRKREKYRDGAIARTSSWKDADGREWYVAVYDIHDLIYVPPDFQNIEGLGMLPRTSQMVAEDRAALRQYSEIFSGYPEDLAAGIPLLRYFGGIGDEFEYRGPKYSLAKQQEIINMINAFVGQRHPEAKVVPVNP